MELQEGGAEMETRVQRYMMAKAVVSAATGATASKRRSKQGQQRQD